MAIRRPRFKPGVILRRLVMSRFPCNRIDA